MSKSPKSSQRVCSVPDAIDLLKTRRSVKPREMGGPGPSPAELETILTVGARGPDTRKLADAPLVIGVVSFTKPHPKVPPWEQELSAGASAMNIVTAATALGYGACWLTGWFAFDRDVLDGLGLKADEKLAGLIHIGTSSKPSEDRPPPALADIVTRF